MAFDDKKNIVNNYKTIITKAVEVHIVAALLLTVNNIRLTEKVYMFDFRILPTGFMVGETVQIPRSVGVIGILI